MRTRRGRSAGPATAAVGVQERPELLEPLSATTGSGFCHAPSVAMEFDARGLVLGCCANGLYPIGRVDRQELRDIWDGDRARFLRARVAQGDLSHGCVTCRWQVTVGEPHPIARLYDRFDPDPDWPRSMAFALSNRCNLQCTMCNGEFSSSIRTRREGRAPLVSPYGDRYFEQLDEFLPHLDEARFLGGEPFLVSEHFRIWDRMEALGLSTPCQVVTNGTRLDRRVRQVLAARPVSVQVSIDAASATLFERIRSGASFDTVLANARTFRDLAREHGTTFGINFCLMRHNWSELGAVLALGDQLEAPVSVIHVQEADHGLHRLPTEQLASVVAALEAEDATRSRMLGLNAGVWREQLDQVAATLSGRRRGQLAEDFLTRPGEQSLVTISRRRRPAAVPAGADRESAVAAAESMLSGWAEDSVTLRCEMDAEDRIRSGVVGGADRWLRWTADDLKGRTLLDLLRELTELHGDNVWVVESSAVAGSDLHLSFSPEPMAKLGLVIRIVTLPGPDGSTSVLAAERIFEPAERG